jgi:hypothetical protein
MQEEEIDCKIYDDEQRPEISESVLAKRFRSLVSLFPLFKVLSMESSSLIYFGLSFRCKSEVRRDGDHEEHENGPMFRFPI